MQPLLFVSFGLALTVACGAAAPAPVPAVVPASAGLAEEPLAPTASISRDEMLAADKANDATTVKSLLVGRWDGRRYPELGGDSPVELDGEVEPGTTADGQRIQLRFDSEGHFVRETSREDDGCVTQGRYDVRADEDGYGNVLLEWKVEEHCETPGSPGWVDTIERISNDLFVIIDGSTAGVSAFRRVP